LGAPRVWIIIRSPFGFRLEEAQLFMVRGSVAFDARPSRPLGGLGLEGLRLEGLGLEGLGLEGLGLEGLGLGGLGLDCLGASGFKA
jgi:hypothetical protein